ncbi:MAG: hypothetical protein R8K20_11895 [Gallionellaceae bacterium]
MGEAMEHEQSHEQSEQDDQELIARVAILGTRLAGQAARLVQRRQPFEQRWLADLRQYEGVYEDTEMAGMRASGGSQVYVNVTRAKVHAAEARLSDMLFPTDDRNWSIDPTPVPEILKHQNSEEEVTNQDGESGQLGDFAKKELDAAKEASKAMQEEIDDQLSESHYNEVSRDVIHDACLLGTGVLKGPVIVGASRKAWQKNSDGYGLEVVEEHRATVERVDLWDFFPDMEASRLPECEYVYQRHHLLGREVYDLLRCPGFIKSQVKILLRNGAQRSADMDAQLSAKRAISGGSSETDYNRFEVWEYHGQVSRTELEACGCEMEEGAEHSLEAIVWFSGNIIIKAVLNPTESGDRPYSVYNWIEDDTSVFGKGLPHQVRSQQRVCNAAWRMVMDDANASIGTQIVFDEDVIEPANGSTKITGRKVWIKKDPAVDIRQAFASFEVPSHQSELMSIYQSARQMIDDETGMPTIAEGDQVGAGAQTMGGMAMMMNASLVILRRAVKNWDDSITVPTIHRFYDWNMQFSSKDNLKGDFQVDARGSSALLVKEMQAQSLMSLMQFAGHPVFGPMTKAASLYRKAVQSHQISPDDIIMTDDEIEQQQKQMADQQGEQQQDPDVAKLQMQQQMQQQKLEMDYKIHQEKLSAAQQESQMRMQEKQIDREIAIAKLAADKDLAIEKINAELVKTRETNQSKQKQQLREIATKQAFGTGL